MPPDLEQAVPKVLMDGTALAAALNHPGAARELLDLAFHERMTLRYQ